MFFLIREISDRRGNLFHIIFSEIQIFCLGISLCVYSQGCDLGTCFIKDTRLSIRMHDVLTGKQSIHGALKNGIPLCHFSGLFIFLYQMDRAIGTFICHILSGRTSNHKIHTI